MKRLAPLLAVLVVVGLGACGNMAAPAAPGGNGNRIPPIIDAGTTGGTGGMGAGGTGGGGSGGMANEGACNNPTDEAALAAVTNPPAQNARGISATCAVAECSDELGRPEADFLECMTTRCLNTSLPGVSPACTSCYADLGWCAQLLCNTACANTPCSNTCLECTEAGSSDYQACLTLLDSCAGRPSRDCE